VPGGCEQVKRRTRKMLRRWRKKMRRITNLLCYQIAAYKLKIHKTFISGIVHITCCFDKIYIQGQ
jgi:hypothetical protein